LDPQSGVYKRGGKKGYYKSGNLTELPDSYYSCRMPIRKQAQQLSLALIKISVSARRIEFRKRLERVAFDLLELSACRDFEGVSSIVTVSKELITFGKIIYEIEPMNAEFLLGECETINKMARDLVGADIEMETPERTLEEIFNKRTENRDEGGIDMEREKKNEYSKKREEKKIIRQSGNGIENPAMRQSAILEEIGRKSGNSAQVREIMSSFPNISERTLRYDLQKLCKEGVVRRIGNGPSTLYEAVQEMV